MYGIALNLYKWILGRALFTFIEIQMKSKDFAYKTGYKIKDLP